jgi:hypothetical protein
MGPAFEQELDSEEVEIAELNRRTDELVSGAVKGLTEEEFWEGIEKAKQERRLAPA